VLGSAVGQAIAHHFSARLQGSALGATEARASFHAAFQLAAENAVFDGADAAERQRSAERLRARGDQLLAHYLASRLAARLEREQVIAIEPRHELRFAGAQWTLIAYLDLVTAQGTIVDVKVGERHRSRSDARHDPQARAYVLARGLCTGGPRPRFAFHSLRHGANPDVAAIPGEPMRFTDAELAGFQQRLIVTARQIARCYASGDWGYASPMGWWCSQRCVAWQHCPGGAAMPAVELAAAA